MKITKLNPKLKKLFGNLGIYRFICLPAGKAGILIFGFWIFFSNSSFADLKVIAHAESFPGRTFVAFLPSSETYKSAKLEFAQREYNFFQYEKGLRAIVGVPLDQKLGDYILTVKAINKEGREEIISAPIIISKKYYPKVSFWLKPAKHKLLKQTDVIVDEWAEIEKQLLIETPAKKWNGFLLKPVNGETSMVFGTRELVNNKPRSQHKGWDLAVNQGSPVKAADNGKVVVAKFYKAYGGTVAIDHGQGIFSIYFHLSKIYAKVGDEVTKGQVFGLSGNTGISSGPHLHFALSVHNLRVDPMQWVQTVIP